MSMGIQFKWWYNFSKINLDTSWARMEKERKVKDLDIQKINNAITTGDFSGINLDNKFIEQTKNSYILNRQGSPKRVIPKNHPNINQQLMNWWTGETDIDYKEPNPYIFGGEKQLGYQEYNIQDVIGKPKPE